MPQSTPPWSRGEGAVGGLPPAPPGGAVMHVELAGPAGRCLVPVPVQAMWLSRRSQ